MFPDDENSLGQLYLHRINGLEVPIHSNPIILGEIVDVSDDTSPDYLDEPYIHLRGFEGCSMTFTLKDPYISRKLFRPVRRWSRKKAQQKKRKIAKEKKHGLLHKDT